MTSDRAWCSFLSLRDPAGASHAAGRPEILAPAGVPAANETGNALDSRVHRLFRSQTFCHDAATPPGSAAMTERLSGGVATLDHRLIAGTPARVLEILSA